MKEGLTQGKALPDPHTWVEVETDIVIRGTSVVVHRIPGKSWLCKRCRSFAPLSVHKWNGYYPELYPCESAQSVSNESPGGNGSSPRPTGGDGSTVPVEINAMEDK
jgi:hypothetical protein